MKNLSLWLVGLFFLLAVIVGSFYAKKMTDKASKSLEISDIEKYRNLTVISVISAEKEEEEKPKPKPRKKVYFVKEGDSINRIAALYKILPWQLRKANGMGVKDSLLRLGQKLIIPKISWKSYVGRASWYGPGFHGKKMANGDIYDQNKVLIAHRTLPLGLKVRIVNLENFKSIVALVLDRGPYTKKNGKYDREVDLSFGAAKILGGVKKGIILVKIIPLAS